MANQSEEEQLGQALQAQVCSMASSVLLHIGIVKAQIDFLQANNSLGTDIKLALSSLSAGPESITTPVGDGPVILSSPLRYTALDAYIGSTVKHLIVHANAEVLVLAWADKGKTAIAYSAKSERVGWISANVLKRNAAQNVGKPDIWLTKWRYPYDDNPAGVVDGRLTWEAGHHILTCKCNLTDKKYVGQLDQLAGVGINVATGDFGEFKEVFVDLLEKLRW